MSRVLIASLLLGGCATTLVPPPPDVPRLVLPEVAGPVSVVSDGGRYTAFEEDCRPLAVDVLTDELRKRGVSVVSSGAASTVRLGCFTRRTAVLVWDRELDPFTRGTCALPAARVLTLRAELSGPAPWVLEVGGTGPIVDRALCQLTADTHERAFWRAFGVDRGERLSAPGVFLVEDR